MSVASFLDNLPSRGTLVAIQPGAAFSAPPVYIADHDTTPQQVVRNDPTNILIRTLQNKRAKEEAKRKQARTADKGKRPVEDPDGSRPAKRQAGAGGDSVGPSGAGGSSSGSIPDPAQSSFTKLGLQVRTIKDLQNVLKAWGLTISGKKDDLIQRILDHQQRARGS